MGMTDSRGISSDATPPARAVLTRPGFLTPAHSSALITAFIETASKTPQTSAHRGPVRVMAHRREVDGRFLARQTPPKTAAVLTSARVSAIDAVSQFYRIDRPLAVEFTLLTEMGPGDQHPLHADNERQQADGKWVPNHTPFRDYVALLYLNTGGIHFEGGTLRFPALHRDIVPVAGDLVGFTCGREHQHEVTPMIHGYRYSVSMWMTANPLFAELWES